MTQIMQRQWYWIWDHFYFKERWPHQKRKESEESAKGLLPSSSSDKDTTWSIKTILGNHQVMLESLYITLHSNQQTNKAQPSSFPNPAAPTQPFAQERQPTPCTTLYVAPLKYSSLHHLSLWPQCLLHQKKMEFTYKDLRLCYRSWTVILQLIQ